MIVNCQISSQIDPIYEKVLPTLISVGVVVFIFIIGRFFDSRIRNKERKRNWYLKVIIEPNVQKVEIFVNDIYASVSNSIEKLVNNKSKISYNEYITLKSIEFGKFQKIKRKFELDFILLIQSNYPKIANDLSILLLELEDTTTNILDSKNLNTDDFDLIEENIKKYKSKFWSLLYKPLVNP